MGGIHHNHINTRPGKEIDTLLGAFTYPYSGAHPKFPL